MLACYGLSVSRHGKHVLSLTRSVFTSAVTMQAPQPFRQIPKAHVLAKTDTPKTLVDVAKAYPDHPLMQFFQMAPTEVPKEGSQGRHADERETIRVPQAVTEADLSHDHSSRAWLAPELRRKSSADLHTLWYVLLHERNKLATSWEELKRHSAQGAAHMLGQSLSYRHHRVRKSMARIKFVLNERRLALIEAQRSAREEVDVPPLENEDDIFEEAPQAS
ncbi:54S ribosomal protein L4 mitochondrial [Malassezia arunalokei]|uniref:Large ribosomal subunit protein uL29m n=1 Tax=Malassezia arunalokei TaxID=1514897 RepID=A0AAJ5Z1B8_9BASI|nr:54S ribosomal protein L4 mitochondrial [Malassezia arunalokei]